MSTNKLAKNTVLYSIGTLLPQVTAFILLPIYTRYLTPSDYGILNSVQVVSSVLAIIYTLAIDKAIYRLYFDHKTENDKRNYLGTIFIGILVSVIFITAILFLFPKVLGSIYENIDYFPYMALGVGASSLATFAIIPRSVYFVQEKANRFILISLSEFFIRNAFIVVFVVFMSKGVTGYLQGQVLGSAVLAPIFILITLRHINFTFIKGALVESLKFSLPMLPTMVSVWVFSASDRVFIERLYDTHDVGIYSLGYKIAMLVTVVSGAFYKAYNPYYFKTATTEDRAVAMPKLRKTNTIYVLFVIVASSLIALFAKEAIEIFFDERYHAAYEIVGVVSLGFAISGFGGVFNLAIYQEKKTSFLMVANIVAALVNLGLNYLFITRYGAMGAAWATTVTYLLLVLITRHYAKKCYYPSFNQKVIFPIFFGLFGLNALFFFVELDFWYSILSKSAVVFLLGIFIWKRYKDDIYMIIKKKKA